MNVQDYITNFALEYDHPYEDSVILKWINLAESNIYGDIIKEYLVKYYVRTLNAFQYSLPDGVNFEDVKGLYVNGKRYKKKDVRSYKEDRTFWLENSKLCFYPSCQDTDKTYVANAGELTFSSSTIATTGGKFNFSIGEVVLVSGCTVNASNNKYATIIGVENDTLTFTPGTFETGTEIGVVALYAPKIKLIYLNVPKAKLIDNIDVDTLIIPDRFIDIYDYYLAAKIANLAKESDEYRNNMALFNARVSEYVSWHDEHRPQEPESNIQASEDW